MPSTREELITLWVGILSAVMLPLLSWLLISTNTLQKNNEMVLGKIDTLSVENRLSIEFMNTQFNTLKEKIENRTFDRYTKSDAEKDKKIVDFEIGVIKSRIDKIENRHDNLLLKDNK